MAQQTRIEAMLPYYRKFIEKYPDIQSLSQADDDDLTKLWQGLGYYNRVRNMKKCAIDCMERYQGSLPKTKAELKKLPGIGDYTAGAIASIAYDEKVSAVDGNVIRVFSRLYNITEDVKYDYYYRTSSREKQLQNGYIALPAESALHAPDFAV